jgi:hypothetical protein
MPKWLIMGSGILNILQTEDQAHLNNMQVFVIYVNFLNLIEARKLKTVAPE